MVRGTLTVCVLACLLTVAGHARAQNPRHDDREVLPPDAPVRSLTVVASSGLGGDFVTLRCDTDDHSGLARLATRLAGEPDALAFDAGGFLGAAALSHLAMDHDADAVSQLAVTLHLRALALDQGDLAMPRDALVRAATSFSARGAPMLLGNLRCMASAAALCAAVIDATDAPWIVNTPEGRVALISAVTPTARDLIARSSAEGLLLDDPAEALARGTLAARAAGARWVIATYDPRIGHELDDALGVARRIPPHAAPDVLFVRRVEGQLRSATVPGRAVTLVATHDGTPVVVNALSPGDPRPARTGEVPEAITSFIVRTHAWLCTEWHRPTAGGMLTAPLDQAAFTNLFLDVLRERTRTEIAVINRGAIDARAPFPLHGAVTPLDVTAALPFDNQLRITRVTSDELNAFLQSSAVQRFHVRGAALENDHVRVNGRPVDDHVRYTLVTLDYVADGGDGGLGGALVFDRAGTETAREVFLDWLAHPHPPPLPAAPLDPARRTLWLVRAAIDTAFSSVIVNNPDPAVFTDAQLARTPSTAGRLDLELHADAFHPLYRFENMVRLLYGATLSTPAGLPVTILETADLIAARSTGVWRGLLSPRRQWYRPRPYVDAYAESEFSKPATRSYQHLEMRPTVGLRFEASERLAVNLGAGVSWEVFATPLDFTPPGATAAPIFNAGFVLSPGHFFPIGTRFAEGELSADVGIRDPFGTLSAQGRVRARISIPLFDPVALTLSYDLYTRYARYFDNDGFLRDNWAVSADASIGLRVTFARALQAFVF